MFSLLEQLLQIQSPSGNEKPMRDFLIRHFEESKNKYLVKPDLLYGPGFQNSLIAVFGKPEVAVFAHMDTVGFMVKYGKELIPVGSPVEEKNAVLEGADPEGKIECLLKVSSRKPKLQYDFERKIEPGTELTFKVSWLENKEHILSPYLDNRLGIWNALELAPHLDNAALVFSAWEEMHGGATASLARFLFERYGIMKALISDVTWTTSGIQKGNGAVISLRDAAIPRREYVQQLLRLAGKSGLPFQLEVEEWGSSDGGELQRSPYPIDWCFIGVPIQDMHSSQEKALKSDIHTVHALYKYLLAHWADMKDI